MYCPPAAENFLLKITPLKGSRIEIAKKRYLANKL